jgi:glyoxalase family protein
VLEIATKGPGYALDEPADALGQRVIQPRSEQLRGNRDEAAIVAATWPDPVPDITADMALDGIHHVTGITSDVERMGAFYEEALGLRPIKKSVNQDDGVTPHWFWGSYDGALVKPHSSLTMFDWKDSTYAARGGAGQTHHIAFRAADAEEQAAWRERLLRMGLDVSPVLDRDYFTSIYFRAPDGLLMEIATDGPGFAVDEELDALGTTLRLPAWLEARREEIAESLPGLP